LDDDDTEGAALKAAIESLVARSIAYLIGIRRVVPRWSHLLSIMCSI